MPAIPGICREVTECTPSSLSSPPPRFANLRRVGPGASVGTAPPKSARPGPAHPPSARGRSVSHAPPPPAEPPRIPERPPWDPPGAEPATPGDAGDPGRRPGALERFAAIPRPAVIGGVVVLAIGGALLTGSLIGGDTIAPETTVNGVDIGGLTPAAAEERLADELGPVADAPIEIVIASPDGSGGGSEPLEVDPTAAGLAPDFAATVERADRPSLLGRLLGRTGGEVDPVVTVEEELAREELTALGEEGGTELREGAISFEDGEPVVTEPVAGTALDVDGALREIRYAYLNDSVERPVELPVEQAQPLTDEAEIERALREFAEPAMSAPITLTAGGESVSVSPAVLGNHLRMEADGDGTLVPEFDGAALAGDPAFTSATDGIVQQPRDAVLGLDGENVVVREDARIGRELDAERLTDTILPLLTEEGSARSAEAPVNEVEPRLTADNLDELGITEQMSSFTVNFDPAPYRITNIGRAAELINGSLVMPGEIWSFNETVGERTEENGFVEGIIILDDQYQTAAGGGVSAVATTMFNAVFFAGVKPVEYGAHSFYIERYPEGREATVAWGHLDNRFENDSGNAVYILASSTDTSVTITFLGTKKYDEIESVTGPRTNVVEPGTREAVADDCVPQPPLEGFDVEVERVFKNGGEEVKRESYRTRYTPRDEVVCEDSGGAPGDAAEAAADGEAAEAEE
ncbi:hypothetical protein FOE67_22985 [Streptomyces calidiresistens]|uniref:Peptidoglycan binding domain-containing protein n=1 Tax=Streptomyces calidiresistens TaxID=1485586 RepID=A0A7W3XYX0_9ACTN|nr:hypothetical protein [Streptomyces calidiresistens]